MCVCVCVYKPEIIVQKVDRVLFIFFKYVVLHERFSSASSLHHAKRFIILSRNDGVVVFVVVTNKSRRKSVVFVVVFFSRHYSGVRGGVDRHGGVLL